MTDQFRIMLVGGPSRSLAIKAIQEAPVGYICKVGPETRTDRQNRLMWPLLTDVDRQVPWHGRARLREPNWKNLFMGSLNDTEYVPSLDGRSVMPLDLSTSILTKPRFSNLIEVIYSFGAERAVTFRTDRKKFEELESAQPNEGEAEGGARPTGLGGARAASQTPRGPGDGGRAEVADGSQEASARQLSQGAK